MSNHNRIYVIPSHIKKIFRNMKRVGKDFSGRVTSLFPTMMVQAQKEMGKGNRSLRKPRERTFNHHYPTIYILTVNEEMDDRLVRDATTASSLEEEQDSAIRDAAAQTRVFTLETTKTTQAHEIVSLKGRVKKLEKKQRSRTHKLKRLYKVGLSARVESSDDEGLGEEDASKLLVNGDSVSLVASASAEGPIPPKTAEQKLARKNELKAKNTLMLAISDEHLLKFHECKDENQEGLDKTYDRFQKLLSQLEIHGEVISQEDANLKLLRSLPSAWNNIALIMRNKFDLDTLSMDDLYNNLKVYESEIKGQSSSSLNSQNVAFVSSDNTSSTNEIVNTAHSISAASSKDQASTTSYADDVMFSFFPNQSNALQLDNEDLEQIDTDDLEEMDLKCKRGYFTRECKAPRNQGNRNRDAPTRNAPAEEELTNFALMAYTSQGSSSSDSKEQDSKDENVFKSKEVKKTVKPSLEKIKFVNARNTTVENENKAKKPRKFSHSPRGNKRNWNGLMTQKLEDRFEFKNKACFITGPREIRPVWDNTARLNHQNKMTHPHPKRNFVPASVLTKSRQVPVNAAKQSSHREATSISAARHVNTAASRPNVNNALPTTYSYFKAHSPVRRPFNKKSAAKTNSFNEMVNTAKVNDITTAGPKVVVSAVEENRNNAVKSSACWIWRPKGNLIDHISKDSGSYS
uniref:Uncharacterized protein n=1 Tax=Tanacetum cinerariifolium TaxID=118510 RepID=A0A6L2J3W5_TANCI|nr:hypothetical protein [Tanacetum cinerariifolium]